MMYAHLDPYLGYLHSIQFAKPSLVCAIQEIFRELIDEFLINYGQKLSENDFENRNGRIFLHEPFDTLFLHIFRAQKTILLTIQFR